MCSLGYHECPSCGEQYHCDQPNSECQVKAGFDTPCEKCNYWSEEIAREDYEKDLERERWKREFLREEDE